jgi:hypothetical protein
VVEALVRELEVSDLDPWRCGKAAKFMEWQN